MLWKKKKNDDDWAINLIKIWYDGDPPDIKFDPTMPKDHVGTFKTACFKPLDNEILFFWPARYYNEKLFIGTLCHEVNHWAQIMLGDFVESVKTMVNRATNTGTICSISSRGIMEIEILERAADWGVRPYTATGVMLPSWKFKDYTVKYRRRRVLKR